MALVRKVMVNLAEC